MTRLRKRPLKAVRGGRTYTQVPPDTSYPADTTPLTYVATNADSMPGFNATIVDSTWSTHIKRITPAPTATETSGWRHGYVKQPFLNYDETIALMYHSTVSKRALVSTADWSIIREATSGQINSNSIWPWNATQGANGLLCCGNSPNSVLAWRNITTFALTTIYDFAPAGWSGLSLGAAEGRLSNDDHYLVLQGTKSGVSGIMIFDLPAARIVATKMFTSAPNNACISQSGLYLNVQFSPSGTGAEQGNWLYANPTGGGFDQTLGAAIRQINTSGGSHGDHAYDGNGSEGWVQTPISNVIYFYRYSDGAVNVVYPNSSLATNLHVTTCNIDRPGWAYFSDLDPVGDAGKLGRDQVYALKLDGSYRVEVFGFSHHAAELYNADPMAIPNRSGHKVYTNGQWGGTDIHMFEYQK